MFAPDSVMPGIVVARVPHERLWEAVFHEVNPAYVLRTARPFSEHVPESDRIPVQYFGPDADAPSLRLLEQALNRLRTDRPRPTPLMRRQFILGDIPCAMAYVEELDGTVSVALTSDPEFFVEAGSGP